MKNLILFENFDLDKFLNNPGEYIHGDSEEIGVGTYIDSYRGKGQILDETPEFWIIEPMDSSGSRVKVPKDLVVKIPADDIGSITSGMSSRENTKNEINNFSDSIEEFMETSVTDEDGEFKYRGNLKTAMDFMNEIVVDIVSLSKRDPNMKNYKEFDRLVSLIAILADNVLESSPQDKTLKEEIEKILSFVGSL